MRVMMRMTLLVVCGALAGVTAFVPSAARPLRISSSTAAACSRHDDTIAFFGKFAKDAEDAKKTANVATRKAGSQQNTARKAAAAKKLAADKAAAAKKAAATKLAAKKAAEKAALAKKQAALKAQKQKKQTAKLGQKRQRQRGGGLLSGLYNADLYGDN